MAKSTTKRPATPAASTTRSPETDWSIPRRALQEAIDFHEYYADAFPSGQPPRRSIATSPDDPSAWISARCPFHEDASPSFSFNAVSGAWICHTGCGKGSFLDFWTIRNSVPFGIAFSQLASAYGVDLPSSTRKFKTDAVYVYRSADGTALYEQVRQVSTDGSSSKPRKKVVTRHKAPGESRYTWRFPADTPRVLYRLPELIASPPSERIYITEGEKDADNLAALGAITTTNSHGAGKWGTLDPESTTIALTDRAITILPDNDKAGRDHAEDVARALSPIAGSVRVLALPDLPPKGDVSDWIQSGGTLEALNTLADATPEWGRGAPPETPPGAPTSQPAGSAPTPAPLANYRVVPYTDPDGNEGESRKFIPLAEITENVLALGHGFPKRLGSSLFVEVGGGQSSPGDTHTSPPSPPSPPTASFLRDHNSLFAHLHHLAPSIQWRQSGQDSEHNCFVTRQELFASLSARAPEIADITNVPLFPLAPDTHVLGGAPDPSTYAHPNGSLLELVDFFDPATPEDVTALLALFLTPMWGGPAGQRPLFVITGSEDQQTQGIGKSTVATLLGLITTSTFLAHFASSNSRSAFSDGIAKQLLSDAALASRVVLFDNLDGFTASQELAELVTAPTIDGRPSHGTQRRRHNTLTYVATAVSPTLDGDLASRSFTIQLTAPKARSSTWLDTVNTFITSNRRTLQLDILHHLAHPPGSPNSQTPPRDPLQPALRTRFPSWEANVLSHVPIPDPGAPNAVLASQLPRSKSVDAETEDLALFLIELHARYQPNYTPYSDRLSTFTLTPTLITAIWNAATGRKVNVAWVSRRLRQLLATGKLPPGLRPKWLNRHGSPWVVRPSELLVGIEEEDCTSSIATSTGANGSTPENPSRSSSVAEPPEHDPELPF